MPAGTPRPRRCGGRRRPGGDAQVGTNSPSNAEAGNGGSGGNGFDSFASGGTGGAGGTGAPVAAAGC